MAIVRIAKSLEDQIQPSAMKNRSSHELAMREALEPWGRARWPDCRVVHELVVGHGTCRADMAFVSPSHLVAIEIKSQHDYADRLFQQACMFSLAAPEVWICVHHRHIEDAQIVRHLMPHLGLIEYKHLPGEEPVLEVLHAAKKRRPHYQMLMGLLWSAELVDEAIRFRLIQSRSGWTIIKMLAILKKLTPEEQMAAVCRQLRGRDAFWRADPPLAREASA